MPPDYESAVASLYALGHELAQTPSHKFDLAHMRVLLQALGNPERRFPSVLVAGTNGKGSTAASLASILIAAGHRTGLYTSPHLVRINERIRVDGLPIGNAEFAAIQDLVGNAAQHLVETGTLPWHPSFFEILTAMAFEHFARSGLEIAVLEVGMGGRLDATNVVEPLISIITDIALDHQKYLGNTLGEIAAEKAGIIRPGGVVVTLPQHPEANTVIGRTIMDRNARPVNAAEYVPNFAPTQAREMSGGQSAATRGGHAMEGYRGLMHHGGGHDISCAANSQEMPRALAPEGRAPYPLTVMGEQILVDSPLRGRHQWRNLALAIAAAEELNRAGIGVTAHDVERGLKQTHWPGRLQRVEVGGLEFLFDVAHNPAGAWALRAALSEGYPERPLTFIFGVMRDKAVAEITRILFPLAARVIATRADNPRSADPEEIRALADATGTDLLCEPVLAAALERTRGWAEPQGLIVVTGSSYVVGETMRLLDISA